MAIALYVAEHLPHPPLELLFTVDGETGLTGAQAPRKDWLQYKQLISLDSEEMGVIQKVKATYSKVFGQLVKVEAIHAGFECGVILKKYPGMEVVSIGPTIKGAHTPNARVEIKSIGEMVEWLKKLCLL